MVDEQAGGWYLDYSFNKLAEDDMQYLRVLSSRPPFWQLL